MDDLRVATACLGAHSSIPLEKQRTRGISLRELPRDCETDRTPADDLWSKEGSCQPSVSYRPVPPTPIEPRCWDGDPLAHLPKGVGAVQLAEIRNKTHSMCDVCTRTVSTSRYSRIHGSKGSGRPAVTCCNPVSTSRTVLPMVDLGCCIDPVMRGSTMARLKSMQIHGCKLDTELHSNNTTTNILALKGSDRVEDGPQSNDPLASMSSQAFVRRS
jgi:hypothetical protein